ncbi:hypothetical protein BH11ACT4_BH11ACT4_01480 [soil metagenome]
MTDPTSGAPETRRTRRILHRVLLPLALGALALGGAGALLGAAPAVASASASTTGLNRSLDVSDHRVAKLIQRSVAHPVAVVAAAATVDEAVAQPVPVAWSIDITAVGRQAEVDACQWVRMDFSSDVPIPWVAAHNFCGGGIVLEMQLGQSVTLSGAGLDGSYVVVGSKDAWADDDATAALAGLSGDVILQTCYWDDNGHLILVALQRT